MSGNNLHILVSGGGTGGHIFPALSIANEIKRRLPDANILFVGADGRMEMEKVPAAGYEIKGLPVCGFDRKHLFRNFKVLGRLYKSMSLAKKILEDFQPVIAIGVGGYASGPMLKEAQKRGIPTLLQEQNSYAGVTNKLLAEKADCICVAYEGMERFFPADKIVMTGNPVRRNLLECTATKEEARKAFNLDPDKKTILIIGGSLGARTVNDSIIGDLGKLAKADGVQVIGSQAKSMTSVAVRLWLSRVRPMSFRCRSSPIWIWLIVPPTLVVSRAGASSVSELQLLGKASILIPSPNVAEDHQTKNALALVNHNAAIMVRDIDAHDKLADTMLKIVFDDGTLAKLSENVGKMALKDAAEHIVDKVLEIIEKKNK
jgi:UDP-N-acetylglucosamine--N-acetylmuramyl-(pentapeptide) pyrophosphoryl-undecaprenol N-acetylglucosamine transferase